MAKQYNFAVEKMTNRRVGRYRKQPNQILCSTDHDLDKDGPELFIAQPADEIPKNKLTDRLVRGLQGYV